MKETLRNYLIKKRMEKVIYSWKVIEDPSRDGNIRVNIKINFNDNIYGVVINVPKFNNPEVGLTHLKSILKKEMLNIFQGIIDKGLEV